MRSSRKRQSVSLMLTVILLAMGLAGCGKTGETPVSSYISIGKEGKITGCIVEAFEKEYYTVEELTDMIQTEITEYNSEKGKEAIVLKNITQPKQEEESGLSEVAVTIIYDSFEDYQDFNGEVLFYGTVEAAVKAGFDLKTALSNVKDAQDTLTEEALLAMQKNHIVIAGEKQEMILPDKALYVSEGVRVLAGKKVAAAQEEGYSYVLMK